MDYYYLKFSHSIIATFLFLSSLQSQIEPDTTIFAPEGATWNYSTWVPPYPPSLLVFISDGDTILNGHHCRILRFYQQEGNELQQVESLNKYVYTDGNKVYYWVIDDFYLLYDFGAQPGDTIYSRVEEFPISLSCFSDFDQGPFDFRYKIDSLGTIEIDGEILRTQFVSPIYTSSQSSWEIVNPIIEKIGQNAISCFWWGRGQTCLLGGIPGELRCYEDANIYFKNNTHFDYDCDYLAGTSSIADTDFPLFPNPTKDILILPESASIINAYNLRGSKVKTLINMDCMNVSDLPPDIYIIQYQINGMWHIEKFVKI